MTAPPPDMRGGDLSKLAKELGVDETVDWTAWAAGTGRDRLSNEQIARILGLKDPGASDSFSGMERP